METATKILFGEHSLDRELFARKRRNARERLELCRETIEYVDTAQKESWAKIIEELLASGFTEGELETELAASKNTIYKWRNGLAAPREMTRRLLKKAILEMVNERISTFND